VSVVDTDVVGFEAPASPAFGRWPVSMKVP
jgi:hypothetical protein